MLVLLQRSPSNLLLLAVTRNIHSDSAKLLGAKSTSIKLVEGDLDAAPALFASAKARAGTTPLWGVFSVQAMAKGDKETVQGKAMVDESIKAGVKHFVYSSVDRGGDDRSWRNLTNIPHFLTKHQVELHLRDKTAGQADRMGWTFLRPFIFMDNLAPGFFGKVFMAMIRDVMKDHPLQWIATKDIGVFAAEAFIDPATWNKRAFGLAGDNLTFSQLSQAFERVTGAPVPTTTGLLGKALKHGVSELGNMVEWFKSEGYKADMAENKSIHPAIMSMEDWIKQSAFVKK